ncbi:MAG: Glycosyl transferase family 2 [Candidatus Collierbacteria bacterium GW2011_GWB1_45_35]|uniref:Glycosyl transferase family 2 n=2 Tax=Candidatus Collieribacteriota TaxID=1752725 RepID=A0A0G1MYH5_9BACT|nr:MAG: Glycosyl transferase family 2 [Microgenomates group bacterium GW2011_GWC1_44_23]KKT85837.1 MAG: Glycosyl transferase family 2 [Candidatus Collierbacteria bacterium GW2011_GWA2_44_99]KKT94616.1 MAG: Glycosyl transferase family 2 [Candidatus Collierbacteria bacterium GW2011_GWA1_45_15]KKT99401.1 MAG: Glycosyl transferase family 2 [Candidatus Collierbacteria bacterium GW2011_GWB2_45_17]KKU04505.1 MAG: Glycosyl transferase family 2 [Candidatus Collierbacteria bacterium GW2011_GWB1_45_35]KK
MKKPAVSVCLPVYNAGSYLRRCLESIVAQALKPIELIIVDDCSTDNSWEIIKKFAKKHSWIHSFQNSRNLGVSPTFNFAITQAKSKYIARMDADDLMAPTRLSLQKKYLDEHSETVIVGGQCYLINDHGKKIGTKRFPLTHPEIYEMLFQTVPMQQPTVMINRNKLPKDFLYSDPRFSPAEDYGLFFSASRFGQFANLPNFTHFYREHDTNISLVRPKFTFWRITRARLDGIFNRGYLPSFKSFLIVLAQTLAILILSEKFIYPLHKHLRGMSKR